MTDKDNNVNNSDNAQSHDDALKQTLEIDVTTASEHNSDQPQDATDNSSKSSNDKDQESHQEISSSSSVHDYVNNNDDEEDEEDDEDDTEQSLDHDTLRNLLAVSAPASSPTSTSEDTTATEDEKNDVEHQDLKSQTNTSDNTNDDVMSSDNFLSLVSQSSNNIDNETQAPTSKPDTETNTPKNQDTDDINLTDNQASGNRPPINPQKKKLAIIFIIIGLLLFLLFIYLIYDPNDSSSKPTESQALKNAKQEVKVEKDYNNGISDIIKKVKLDTPPPTVKPEPETPKDDSASPANSNTVLSYNLNNKDDDIVEDKKPTPPTQTNAQLKRMQYIALRSGGIKIVNVNSKASVKPTHDSNVVTLSNAIPKANNDQATSQNTISSVGQVDVIRDRSDPNYLLSMDTPIRCSLNQQIVNTYSGNISCTITNNIYSVNGKNILIPKGSKAIGIYGAIAVPQGDNKLVIGFEQIRTPDHRYLNVRGNQGGNNLGVRGITGSVDHRFFSKLGQYLMLSMVGDVGSYISYRLRGNTPDEFVSDVSTVKSPDFTAETRSTIEQYIKQSLQENLSKYQPTVTINQGTEINILLNRDVYFDESVR